MRRNFEKKSCDNCGNVYTPTASKQENCATCMLPIRKKRAAEAMAKYRNSDPLKVRRREANNVLKRVYGITLEGYEAMVIAQGGKCALCGHEPNGGRGIIRKLYVDHCHTTKAVRGLLCINCNTGLGSFGESVLRLSKAIDYLKKHAVQK